MRAVLPALLCLLLGCPTHDGGDLPARAQDDHGDRHDDEPGDRAEKVSLDERAVARARIVVAEVQKEVLAGSVEAPAEVLLDPDRTAHVSPLVEGQLLEVKAAIGDAVKQGQVLVVLQSIALGETRASLAEARAAVQVARANHARQQELAAAGVGVQRNLVEAQGELDRAQARLSGLQSRARVYGGAGKGATTVIRSPISGRVLERHATVGEVVSPGADLFKVADLGKVWVVGQVYAQDVALAQQGAAVTLSLPALPARTFTGTLDYVAPALDAHTRTLPVRVVLDNEDGSLKPGLFGTLRLADPRAGSGPVPAITSAAVQTVEGRDVVFVPAREPGTFATRPVRVGPRVGELVPVLEGLKVSDRYVRQGAFVLKSKLRAGELADGHDH